jgi:DNA-binding transcriptional LysR family regulator
MIPYFRTFVVAAETSSFSAAGERLGLTQSAVSAQIRRLEEELGCNLFERTGKSVCVSEDGRALLPDAIRLLELFKAMKERSHGVTRSPPIDLGSISTVQSTLLPKALQQFRREHSGVHVNIVPGMSVQLLTQVDSRELDIAVMIKPRLGIPSDLKWITLMQERYIAVAPADAPAILKDLLASLPFIRYNRRSSGGQLVDRFLKQHGLGVKDGMELDEPSVILKMVDEGLGWAIIPGELVSLKAATNVAVVALPGRPFFREIGVLVRLSALKRPATASLIESLKNAVELCRSNSLQ